MQLILTYVLIQLIPYLIPYYMIMRAQPLIRDSSCAMCAIWNYNKTTLAKAFSQNNFLHNQVVGMSVDSNIRVVELSPF